MMALHCTSGYSKQSVQSEVADRFNVVAREQLPSFGKHHFSSRIQHCQAAWARKGGKEITSPSPGHVGISGAEMPVSKALVL